jgi:two-component system, OmpR family, phosphate regulon sensor histidine kinase PhoR
MDKHWKKITFIILCVVLIPAFIVTVYELSSLKNSAEEFQQAYTQQLDAILFSVNQYTEDVLSKWVDNLETVYVKDQAKNDFSASKEMISSNPLFDIMIVFDGISGKIKNLVYDESEINLSVTNKFIENTWRLNKLVKRDSLKLNRLLKYKNNEFTKIEPIDYEDPPFIDLSPENKISKIAFVAGNKLSGYDLVILSIDDGEFFRKIVIPKIESLDQSEVEISIISDNNEKVLYSSASHEDPEILLKKNIWILPQYSLGISQLGESLHQVIQDRRTINLSIVFFFDFCLMIAVWIIARYMKKEALLSQQKSDFVSNVSHELRTPLSLIKMYTESLEMGRVQDEAKRKEYFSVINNETDRLSSILSKILNFSRMEAGKRKFAFDECNINDLVEKVVTTYEYQLKERGFDFSFAKCEEDCILSVDAKAIEEALANLIDNAIKYSKKNKFIQVNTYKNDNTVCVEVKDQGMGISTEDQKKIFEKFYRVSTGLVHDTKGSGLGLTLVKHIMTGHHGYVLIESKPDEGSKFTLVFPIENNNHEA